MLSIGPSGLRLARAPHLHQITARRMQGRIVLLSRCYHRETPKPRRVTSLQCQRKHVIVGIVTILGSLSQRFSN